MFQQNIVSKFFLENSSRTIHAFLVHFCVNVFLVLHFHRVFGIVILLYRKSSFLEINYHFKVLWYGLQILCNWFRNTVSRNYWSTV